MLNQVLNLFNSLLFKLIVLIDEPNEKFIVNMLIIVLFSIIYHIVYIMNPERAYSIKNLSYSDMLYYSCTVHFTLGFGDIFPVSRLARGFTIIQSILFWFVNLINTDIVKKYIKLKN